MGEGDAARWLLRAQEVRALARGTTDPNIRFVMLKVANDYEAMAMQAYRLAEVERFRKRSTKAQRAKDC
jgi:hypothetical protein